MIPTPGERFKFTLRDSIIHPLRYRLTLSDLDLMDQCRSKCNAGKNFDLKYYRIFFKFISDLVECIVQCENDSTCISQCSRDSADCDQSKLN